jgi:hypothetical protein
VWGRAWRNVSWLSSSVTNTAPSLWRTPPHAPQVQAGEDLLCKQATGQDLKAVCKSSCTSACESALAAYEARLTAETGLTLDPKERSRVLKNCRHSCSYECTKSGKAHDFVVPSRR